MRRAYLFGFITLGLAFLLLLPAMSTGQPGGKKGGGFPGGGGFQFGGGGGMMAMGDPSQIFEMLSRNRGFFLISDTRSLRDPLTKYAQDKGIANGQITKAQFVDFYEGFKAKISAPPAAPGSDKGTPGTPPTDGGKGGFKSMFGSKGERPPGPGASPDALNEWADKEFERRDRNGDKKLNQEETPSSLRENLAKWDKNGDAFIDINEFREYFLARVNGDSNDPNKAAIGIAAIIIDDDELDRKPIVFRAGGKMPANLPAWFKELDKDEDGQVAFAEWRRGGKDLDEFIKWDQNDDSFITPQEASKYYATLGKDNKSGPGGSVAGGGGNGDRPSFGGKGGRPSFGGGTPQADGAGATPPPFGGFGKGGFSGFGKGKKSDRQP